MKKITSFTVDHTKLKEGIYVSRIDGDCVTYDLRFCRPNTGFILTNSSIHTLEHMLATFLRNSEISESVIYFGPMGCQTGFYLIIRDDVSHEQVLKVLKKCLKQTMEYEGEVFGASVKECGNYINLDLNYAKKICGPYLSIIEDIESIPTYDDVC